MVTMHPSRTRVSNRSGITVLSLDFPAVARCPSTRAVGGKGTDQMQRRGPQRARAPAGLAVDTDHFILVQRRQHGTHPASERRPKLLGINGGKQSPKRVMRGDPMREPQILSQPSELRLAPGFNLDKVIGPREHRTHGNHQHFRQGVFDFACLPRIPHPNQDLRQPLPAFCRHGLAQKRQKTT